MKKQAPIVHLRRKDIFEYDHKLSLRDFDNLNHLSQYFTDEKECYRFLEQYRWKNGIAVCPYCGSVHSYNRSDGRHKCALCGKSFSVLQGTIFENTKLPLRKWFMAIYLMAGHKKGISSCQLATDINVSQKTAWFMEHKIRTLFVQDEYLMFEELVECDEMYAGGREYNKHEEDKVEGTQGRSTKRKSPVFGMVGCIVKRDEAGYEYDRVWQVYAKVVKNCKGDTLLPIIDKHIKVGTTVVTDTGKMYNKLMDKCIKCHDHQQVNHSEKFFGNEEGYTTNHIEGFWGIFRRGVIGTYHYMSKKYLHRYVDEVVFRFNNKDYAIGAVAQRMLEMAMGNVTYSMVKQIKNVA